MSLLFCKRLRCCFFLFFAMAPLPVWCAVGSLLLPSCCFPADSLQFRCWIANLFAAGSLLLCLGFAAGLMMVAMLPLGWFDVASCCWFIVALPSVHCLSCAGSSLVRCWFNGGSFVVHSCSVVGSCVVRWWFPVASLLTHSIFASVLQMVLLLVLCCCAVGSLLVFFWFVVCSLRVRPRDRRWFATGSRLVRCWFIVDLLVVHCWFAGGSRCFPADSQQFRCWLASWLVAGCFAYALWPAG